MRQALTLILLGVNSLFLFAEDPEKEQLHFRKWKLGSVAHTGYLINHSHKIKPINEEAASGFEITVARQTYGENDWNRFFNYPEYGLSYTWMNVGSPDYVGTAHCLFPFLNFHLISNRSPFNLNMRLGTGLAYVEKLYDAESNPLNLAVSTHLNFALSLQFQASFQLHPQWYLLAGTGLTHISNGAFQVPNTGLNVVTFSAGAAYSFGTKKAVENRTVSFSRKKNWQPALFLAGGVKEILPPGGDRYLVGNVSFELSKQHLDFTRFAGILDITYDTSDYDFLVNESQTPPNRLSTVKIGLAAGYFFTFDRLTGVIQLGAYAYTKNKDLGIIYQRTGLRYALSDRTSIQLALRNQKGKANFVEFGLGYHW